MGLINTIKRWFGMVFGNKAREEFDVQSITSGDMQNFLSKCSDIYHGRPDWVDVYKDIKTVNFAKFICSETAKLSTLGLKVEIEGDSTRVKAIQKQIDEAKKNVRQWVEYAGAYGTVILKPNGKSVDCILPNRYLITEESNGNIDGAVFFFQEVSSDRKTFWTRLEYHRFVNDVYVITNRCFSGKTENDLNEIVDIKETPWAYLAEEVAIKNIDQPLFGVLKMPSANSIDIDSPLAMPIFAEAIEELKDLDIAYSRNAKEIKDSSRIVLLDADRLIPSKGNNMNPKAWSVKIGEMGLPNFVRNVLGDGANSIYEEINPELNTEVRIKGINALLSQIGFKCGFSNGYFVFNESTGFTTATQVTSDQARTIQLIKDIRHNIDSALIDLVKAINVFEDLYGSSGHLDITDTTETPELERTIHVHFDPIYTNEEEDRQRALQLTNSGYYPKWYYLHMWEGLSEEDAKALTEEAQPKQTGLFDE